MSQDKEREALLPCPFCGAEAAMGEVPDGHEDAGGRFVYCTNSACAASSALIFPLMDDVAALLLERWNRRAALASQQAGKGEPYAHIVELPAGEYAGTVKFFTAPSDPRGRPVYLNQPSPPSREPLTDEQQLKAFQRFRHQWKHPQEPGNGDFFVAGIEAAEAHHGIHSREGESNDH